MANEVFTENGRDWEFICSGCWKKEPSAGAKPFNNKKEAEIALQLHKIGCKKS